MACTRALLVARVLLVLHLIRGQTGVSLVGPLLCQRRFQAGFSVENVSRDMFKLLYSTVADKLRSLGKSETHISHAEGLNAGYSGIHPLRALAFCQEARKLFEEVASAWSRVLIKWLCKGYRVQSADAMQLWKGVKNRAPLAVRTTKKILKSKTTFHRRVMKAGKYSSMHLARSVAALSVPVFKRQVVDYGLELHKAMVSGQSEVRHGIANVGEAELSSTVFAFLSYDSGSIQHDATHGASQFHWVSMCCVSRHQRCDNYLANSIGASLRGQTVFEPILLRCA